MANKMRTASTMGSIVSRDDDGVVTIGGGPVVETGVGAVVGTGVGAVVGTGVGAVVGTGVGAVVGTGVGATEISKEALAEGYPSGSPQRWQATNS
jgi:hypothetical protein